jgi:exocyst complex component 4
VLCDLTLVVPRKEYLAKYLNGLDVSSFMFPLRGIPGEGYSKTFVGLDTLRESLPFSDSHPERDSFSYITQIILALHSLSQVHRAMDTLSQRLPLEIYHLVDRTIQEVEARHTLDLRGIGTKTQYQFLAGISKPSPNSLVLADLLWTLYSKLVAVLNGHRVVYDAVLAIVKDSSNIDKLSDTPEFNYIEVWKPIQSEVTAV